VDVPDDEPCVVRADPARLEQVLANLLSNAVKYSPSGGQIRVSVRPASSEGSGAPAAPGASDGSDGDGVAIVVQDPGIGLPAGAAQQIFQPFGRASNATELNVPGMGLGLFVSRGIVERHGGRITAESAGEGRGTSVTVWLPCGPADAGPADAA
jgi:signal transduction histidine kinase